MSNMIPKYGEVRWRDAYGNDGTTKVRAGKMKKTLPIKASIGHLFMDTDGTLAIVHEYEPTPGVYQHNVEMTVVPDGWKVEIIPLIPKEEEKVAIHKAVPSTST